MCWCKNCISLFLWEWSLALDIYTAVPTGTIRTSVASFLCSEINECAYSKRVVLQLRLCSITQGDCLSLIDSQMCIVYSTRYIGWYRWAEWKIMDQRYNERR